MPAVASYGSWKSPITTGLIVSGAVGLGQIALDGDDVHWVEMRPSEGGRMVVVRRAADGTTSDMTPEPYSARTRVHEYGGGAILVNRGVVYFSNFSDQRLYRQDPGSEPKAITPDEPLRYADGVFDEGRGRIVCVREDHSRDGEPVNAIVGVDAEGHKPQQVLFSGSDFCAAPRLSPDGTTLAWLAWDHPNMPWDGTRLLAADVLQDGKLGDPRVVAGGAGESVLLPLWSPQGELHFVSDRNGWWNLYRWRNESVQPVLEMEAEFARPQWGFDPAAYGFLEDGRIACSFVERGVWNIGIVEPESGQLTRLDLPYSEMGRGELRVSRNRLVFTAGAPDRAMALLSLDVPSGAVETLQQAHDLDVSPEYLSAPEAVEFETTGGRTAHAFFYPPRNPDFVAPEGEKPPLLVKSHGGPTAAAQTALDLGIQYWTSRGFGVVDVNYGGSTGYGTEYRRRLNGTWGITDVDDCVNAARFLAERGDVDGERLAIDGASAGGYTTLAALTFHDAFRAGASLYGVSDLEALAQETHKFESRYLDSLVGPYPERQDLYFERSPINHTHLLSCPLLLLQGLEDEIVPPNQAEMMFEAVKAKGLATAYIPFEGEQHGFRRSENIQRALEAELYFYSASSASSLRMRFEPVVDREPARLSNTGGAARAHPTGPCGRGGRRSCCTSRRSRCAVR